MLDLIKGKKNSIRQSESLYRIKYINNLFEDIKNDITRNFIIYMIINKNNKYIKNLMEGFRIEILAKFKPTKKQLQQYRQELINEEVPENYITKERLLNDYKNDKYFNSQEYIVILYEKIYNYFKREKLLRSTTNLLNLFSLLKKVLYIFY